MPFDPVAFAVDSAILADPAFSQQISYQRTQGNRFDAVDPFTIRASICTGGDYASPEGAIYADVLLQTAAIPLGPQKGDQIAINDSAVQDGTYVVQEVFWDRKAGSAHLKVRWIGQ